VTVWDDDDDEIGAKYIHMAISEAYILFWYELDCRRSSMYMGSQAT